MDSGAMVTIEDSCRGMVGYEGSGSPLEGLTMAKLPARYVGKLLNVSPEYALGVWVDRLAIFGAHVGGFQRNLDSGHARKIARAMKEEGVPMPPVILAVIPGDTSGTIRVVDGQHRLVATVLSRIPVPGVILEMTLAQQMAMFAGQRNGMKIARGHITLSGSNAIQEYIQDAVTSESHPWSEVIAPNVNGTRYKIGPSIAEHILTHYAMGTIATAPLPHIADNVIAERFTTKGAEELLDLIMAWGPKATQNTWPWRPVYLKAVTGLATLVVQRRGSTDEVKAMWEDTVPGFPWESHAPFCHGSGPWLKELIAYWTEATGQHIPMRPGR